ncbi:MAG: HD domain-containing phosphohydrolase [Bacillota bacterium]
MNKKTSMKISFYNVIKTIADSIDLMSIEISGHHKLVAYNALRIGIELNLTDRELRKLVFSSLIHDIGILYFDENIDYLVRDRENEEHAYVGHILLEDFFPFDGYAQVLKNHHQDWYNLKENENNFLSNILNLADIIAYFIDKEKTTNILQTDYIKNKIHKYCDKKINDEILSKFDTLSKQESFWLDITNLEIRERMLDDYIRNYLDIYLNIDQVMEISEIVSHIIDFRNPFTATHSKGIATISSNLAKDFSFSDLDVKIMEIAGYFHDIGKMIVPLSIINKKGKLTKKEWGLMKSHTYYSYHVLNNIKEIPQLKNWAAFHHETLDGRGYPFNIDKNDICLGARILAVSDIFTAITENRPYRDGYNKDKVIKILKDNVKRNKIDKKVVNQLLDNYDYYNKLRKKQQEKAIQAYKNFKYKTIDEINEIYY